METKDDDKFGTTSLLGIPPRFIGPIPKSLCFCLHIAIYYHLM